MSDQLKIVDLLPGQSFFPPKGETEPAIAIHSSSINGAFTLDLTEFAIIETGPGIPADERILGYHFGVVLQQQELSESSGLVLNFRGFASLDEGVTAALTVLIGDRIYKREFYGLLDDDFRWRISYLETPIFGNLQLPIVLMLSINNHENRHGSGLFTCDSVDGEVEGPPTDHDIKETCERMQKRKETYRMRRAKKSELS